MKSQLVTKYVQGKVADMSALLSEIDIGNSGDCLPTLHSDRVCQLQKSIVSPDFDSTCTLWHPVTLLYQICQDLQWPSPLYKLINEEISSTRHTFTLECRVLQHRGTGIGFSKKKAKRAASVALLEKIKENADLKGYSSVIRSQISVFNGEGVTEDSAEDGGAATTELYKMCYSLRWPFPVYGLISVEGPVHDRLFKVGCTMPGLTELAEGTGHSKKEAKHSASQALLNKLMDDVCDSLSSCTIDSSREEGNEYCQKVKAPKNATSLLNELCLSYSWPFPHYEFVHEGGTSNRRVFTIGCSLLGQRELGTGFTKKEAKHAASLAMLLKIRGYLEDTLPLLNNCAFKEKNGAEFSCESDLSKDAISYVHEICASRSWPHPTYKLLSEETLPDNQKLFTIGCCVVDHTPLMKGTGCSKKKAKHAASQALLEKMKSDVNSASTLHLHTKNCICDLEQPFPDVDKR